MIKTNNKVKNKGITLIALIITIIILLILAGVAISTLTGDDGLFSRAKKAKDESEIASIKEQIQTDILGEQVVNEGNISEVALEAILKKYVANPETDIIKNEDGTIKEIITKKGNYKIAMTDIWNGKTSESVKIANEPDIKGFDKNNTYYVAWDLTSSPYTIQESNNLTQTAPSNWYNYEAGVNQWANVKTTGGDNDCYWVWIPRYAYKIAKGYHSSTAGTIEIKFLEGTTNTPIDGSKIDIKNQTGAGNWNVHPAFWFDENNNGTEDDGEQLAGIWVAKYEASSSSVGETTIDTDLTTTGGGDTNTLHVRVKPNVTSWRGISLNNIITVCKNLTTSGNSLENTNSIDSHMMKNTEWGAVAYLSRSIYGKNDEVWNNPFYNNTTNYSPITGLCGKETESKDLITTELSKTCEYNEINGGNASTTGNVYGVYDMAGGAWEYVAGILSSYKSNSNNYNSTTYPDKYFDWYNGDSSDKNTNYNANTNKYGDAVYETSHSGDSDGGSWDSSYSKFPNSSGPVFVRGGRAYNGKPADVFAFDFYADGSNGANTYTYYSFRPVIINL